MQKDKQKFLLQVMLIVFLSLLIAYPVTFYIKRANNPAAYVTDKQLKAFEADNLEIKDETQQTVAAQPADQQGGGISVGEQTTRYSNTGQAILSVSVANITKLSRDDFRKIGQTPWSLMNTVQANMATPQVIDIVFNNDDVISGFMSRNSTVELTSNYMKMYDLLMQGSYGIEKFVTNPTVQAAVNNDAVLRAIANSKLVARLANTPAAQYFKDNPALLKKLLGNNPSLRALVDNPKVKQILLTNPSTNAAAPALY